MMWKRNEDRLKQGPGPLTVFEESLNRIINDAKAGGVMSLHLARALQNRADWLSHEASLFNAARGGR
jgi:hypothetical protein